MIKVSVIIPVYGVEKYIEKCLNSLVKQSLEDIEIIVVNDGTKDKSQDIIDKYVKKYPKKIKSYIKENGGQGSARNYGLKKAHGEYIGFVDSDDYIDKDMYRKLYNKAKKSNSDIVICNYQNVFEDNDKKIDNTMFLKTDDSKVNALFNNVSIWNKLYKRELLNNIFFKEKVWYEDLAFNSKTILNAKKIEFLDESLYFYLNRPGSTMTNSNLNRNLEILDAFDDIISYTKENKIYDKYYDEIEYLAIFHIFITAITRVINIDNVSGKQDIIDKLSNYMNKEFPTYRRNKYLKLLDKNKKIVYNLNRFKLYPVVKLIFKIKRSV